MSLHHHPKHAIIGVLVVAAITAVSAEPVQAGRPKARAKPPKPLAMTAAEEAQQLLERGIEHYSARRYVQAIEAFRQSQALQPSPKVRVNVALALWKHGEAVAAARELQLLLATNDNTPAVVERARGLLIDITKDLGRIDLEVRATGVVWLDGRRHGMGPLVETLWVTPGDHEIRIDGQKRRVTAQPGQPVQTRIDVAPPRAKLRAPSPAGPDSPRLVSPLPRDEPQHWRWIVPVAVTSAALASGVRFGLAAREDEQKLRDLNRDSASHDYALAAATATRGQRHALFANLSFAVAAAGALTVTWVVLSDRRRDRVEVGFGGSYAYARGTF